LLQPGTVLSGSVAPDVGEGSPQKVVWPSDSKSSKSGLIQRLPSG
jgi:hypothetical protein